ncbi:luciferase family oxidoreductase group 1 [Rhizobium leguminosarum]|uniref:Luciferase family oxidoreductase group 1 n=1 Tax=Rhizobium leguminosarum TaxID=384 RepID=A0AAE2MRE4_RHILE|nr:MULTISPECIES: MsnO8 family LLM class oxidoreductase [Rhizobium]MBB4294107.1 luciferase family oxidoreductase group 1 [Rhizobium leguminosarum]MBB4311861.1 luciferase family oxidoreductase group 1 [Rhizobium leguminosarum]MBB4420895.1 luciferase family oxidoreductase group 1 [Rhizobium leguminosarum]MBB4436069.1 luciferase family oxidoreductase group 1 [Rhizobium esperanzae]MBB4533072.1 luciferase family oxidoreductase group 1 [Rhizobium leguminosarum]
MSYALSFLDKSPIHGPEPAAAALQRSLSLAKRAEDLGYRRFWVAEHHNSPSLASSSPEVLISFLLARTSRINIGSGGVMLQHYSAYKVAENFNLLAALAPGRVDLGVGKAPGGLPLSTRALQQAYDPERKPSFSEQLTELDGFLHHGDAGQSQDERPVAFPVPDQPPGRFVLGASAESATLAARLGWGFVYAAHIHGDASAIAEALAAYRNAGGTSALLALSVITAETNALAESIGGETRRFRVEVEGGQAVNVGSEDQAREYVRQSGKTQYQIEERSPRLIRGTPSSVHAELQQLHRTYGVAEFIIDCPLSDGAQRLKTIELLAAGRAAIAA